MAAKLLATMTRATNNLNDTSANSYDGTDVHGGSGYTTTFSGYVTAKVIIDNMYASKSHFGTFKYKIAIVDDETGFQTDVYNTVNNDHDATGIDEIHWTATVANQGGILFYTIPFYVQTGDRVYIYVHSDHADDDGTTNACDSEIKYYAMDNISYINGEDPMTTSDVETACSTSLNTAMPTPALGSVNDLLTIAKLNTDSIEDKVDIVDTNVDSVLVDTGITLDAKMVTLQTDIDDLTTNITVASITSGVWNEVLTAGTYGTLNSAGARVIAIEADVNTVMADVAAVDALVVIVDTVVDTLATDITLIKVADAVWDEVITVGAFNITDSAGKRLREIDAVVPLIGSGAIEHTYTVTDGVNPLEGVGVWVTTDIGGSNVVAGTLTTNVSGVVEFMLDAGTYYFWSQKAGYNFTNPDTEAVA